MGDGEALSVAAMGLLPVARCEESVRKKGKRKKNLNENRVVSFSIQKRNSGSAPGMEDAAGMFQLVTAREEQLFPPFTTLRHILSRFLSGFSKLSQFFPNFCKSYAITPSPEGSFPALSQQIPLNPDSRLPRQGFVRSAPPTHRISHNHPHGPSSPLPSPFL